MPEWEELPATIGWGPVTRTTLLVIVLFLFSVLLTIKWEAMDAEAYFVRAEKYARRGRFYDAIGDYSKAIELDPEHLESYRKRAVARMNLKEYRMAISDQNTVLGKNPCYGKVYYDRGISYYFLEQHGTACKDMRKACDLGHYDGCVQARLAC